MRLTNPIRKQLLADAMRQIFEPKIAALEKRVKALIVAAHKAQYGRDVEKLQALNLDNAWLVEHGGRIDVKHKGEYVSFCTKRAPRYRFNMQKSEFEARGQVERRLARSGGYSVAEPLVFPSFEAGTVTVNTAVLSSRVAAIRAKGIELRDEEKRMSAELQGFLAACKSSKDIEVNWPEGVRYLPPEPVKGAALPVPLIDDVRKAMS